MRNWKAIVYLLWLITPTDTTQCEAMGYAAAISERPGHVKCIVPIRGTEAAYWERRREYK